MKCYWLFDTNPNSEFLLAVFKKGVYCEFVIVFEGFNSPKYICRIPLPDVVYSISLNLIVVGEQTVLVRESRDDQSEVCWPVIYNLSTGQAVSCPYQMSDNGQMPEITEFGFRIIDSFLVPVSGPLRPEASDLDTGWVNRIDSNGTEWNISTLYISLPPSTNGETPQLDYVTDTQLVWAGADYFIVRDYL